MTRYMPALPTAAYWEANGSDYLARSVMELERKPRDTGLLDANGHKLFAHDEPNPIGFVWHRQ